MSAEIGPVLLKLDAYASELDGCSKKLAKTEEELEPLEDSYQEAMDDFESACWERHEKDGEKLPPEHMRQVLARKTMPLETILVRSSLISRRKRLEKRIRTLSDLVDAQRSILSALKTEMEAVR